MKKLTKREMLLIYVLIVLIIVMGGWFLLANPAIQKSHKLQLQLDEISMQVDSLKLSDIELSDEEVNKATKEYEILKTNFNEMLTLEEMDVKLTSLVSKYHFIPLSLEMKEIKKQEIKPFYYDEEKDKEKKYPKVYVGNVSMELKGTYSQLAPLVEEVKELPGIKITSFSQTSVDNLIKIDFDCYMVQ
ncbi:MAG: hypothetical protein RR945_10810 [Erysipelotrichaceae bacterium]